MTPTRRAAIALLAALALAAPHAAAGQDPQAPAAAAGPTEEPVKLQLERGVLNGTLDVPAGAPPFPAVLVIAGSGPTDRDGNQPMMKNDSLKRLGRALAERGIAVLRFDKRGIAQSSLAMLNEAELRFDMLVDDAAAWIAQLRGDPRVGAVGVVGHSEGALIGTLAAARADAGAVVSLAGAGRPLQDVLREQLAPKLPPKLAEASDRLIDTLVAGRTDDDVPPELWALYRPSVQPYLVSLFRHDPAEALAALDVPVLIVQGEHDLQVSLADAEALAAANERARLHVVDGMNHVLKTAGTLAEQQAAYTDPSLPLTAGLADTVAAFLHEALGAPAEKVGTPAGAAGAEAEGD